MSNPTPMEQLKISQEFYLRKYLELTPQEQQLYPQFQQEMKVTKSVVEAHSLLKELAARLRNQQNQ